MATLVIENKAWTRSIKELIQRREYEEAYGLTLYFPATVENRFLQCASLAGMDQYYSADKLLTEVPADTGNAVQEWADIFGRDSEFLIHLSIQASTQNCENLGRLCIEAALTTESVSEKGLALALCHVTLLLLEQDAEEAGRLLRQIEASERDLAEAARSVYEDYPSYRSQYTLWLLLERRENIPRKSMASLLGPLFDFDLELHENDVTQRLGRMSVPPEIREVIERGLAKQTIRPSPESSDELRFRGEASAVMSVGGGQDWDMGEEREAAAPPRRRIARHTLVEFPARCTWQEPVTLSIQLTRNVPALTRVLKKIRVRVRENVQTIRFDVHVTAPGFALQEHKRTMSMGVDSDSEKVDFTLFPVAWGEQVVEIELFHESSRVGYLIVGTIVGSSGMDRETPGLVVMEDPIQNLDEPVLQDGVRRRVLWVRWDEQKATIAYDLKGLRSEDSFEGEKPFPQLRKDIEDYLKEVNEFLNEAVVQAKPSDDLWDSMCLTLRGYGARLFDQLVPAKLAEKCRKWEPGITLIVSTNENWIPWELLFDGKDFWGKRYLLGRYPRFPADRPAPTKGRAATRGLRLPNHALNVIGGDIPTPDVEQVKKLFEKCLKGECVKILETPPVSVFNMNLATKDLIHCTCHGRTNPHMLQLSARQSRLENLLLEAVGELSLEEGSLVFANACSSNVPVLTFGQFGSFGWEFYRRGAGAFIGTLGAVPTRYAIPFAESVYAELFDQARTQSIGQAMTRAKELAAQNRNLFWLLYMVYGDPDLNLKGKT